MHKIPELPSICNSFKSGDILLLQSFEFLLLPVRIHEYLYFLIKNPIIFIKANKYL